MAIVPQNNFTQQSFDFDSLADQPVPELVLHATHELPQDQKYWWTDLEYQHIPRKPGIYAIVNTLNGHFYIGSAVNLANRKREHFGDLRKDKHPNPRLQNSYNRDGANAFRFAIVERVEHAETLIMFEQHYIDNLRPEYNLAPIAGSTLGVKYSEESKAKLSAARRAYPGLADDLARATEAARIANTGRKLSPEHLDKLRGRKHTPESIERMSIAQRERERSPEEIERLRTLNIGRVHTPESRENMGAPKRGRKQSPEHIEKRSAARRGKPLSPEHAEKARVAFLGGKHTDESKAKMSAAGRGRKQSPEHVAKRTAGQIGKKADPEHMSKMTEAARIANTGKTHSPETIAKMKEAWARRRERKAKEEQSEQPPLF